MTTDKPTSGSTPASPFNRTAQHDAKRGAILSQAAKLFNSQGSRATTLRDIAESLGLTKTSLYYYVKTKEELIYQCYMATLQRHHQILDEIERDHQEPLARAAAFVQQHFDSWLAAEQGHGNHMAALLEIASLKGAHRVEVETQYIAMFKRLRQYLRDGIANGSIRNCDASSATRAVMGSVEWTFYWLHTIPKDQVEKVAQEAMDILAHGIFGQKQEYKASGLQFSALEGSQLQGFDREQQNRLKQIAFYKTGTWFFNKQGFNGTSLDEIAEHLHVSKGAFYYHIKSKEDLLFNCYSRSHDIVAAIHNQAEKLEGSGLKKVEQTCRQIFYVQNSDQGPLIRYNSITSLPIPRRKKVLQRTAESNQRFGDFLRQGIEDGSVRPINVDIAVNMIAGVINASMDIHLWRKVDDIDTAAIEYFDIIYNGLLPRA